MRLYILRDTLLSKRTIENRGPLLLWCFRIHESERELLLTELTMVANGLIVRSKSRLQSLFIQLAAKFEVDLPVYMRRK